MQRHIAMATARYKATMDRTPKTVYRWPHSVIYDYVEVGLNAELNEDDLEPIVTVLPDDYFAGQ